MMDSNEGKFVITDSNESKNFIRRRETVQKDKNQLLKIDTIVSNDEKLYQNKSVAIS